MGSHKGERQKHLNTVTPKSIKTAFHLNEKIFRWSFENCLWEHKCWQKCESIKFFVEHVISKLQQFETMKWQEILDSSGGKTEGRGNNNHFIKATELPKEEQKKFIKLDYMNKFDEVFSLRLSGRERLIGVVDLNIFKILWFDANHELF